MNVNVLNMLMLTAGKTLINKKCCIGPNHNH